jgi:hypothetical protein
MLTTTSAVAVSLRLSAFFSVATLQSEVPEALSPGG